MSSRPNPHISYNLTLRPHHKVIAELIDGHTNNDSAVLDIGCGMGHMAGLVKLTKPSLNLSVADIDKTVLEATENKVEVVEAIQIDSVESLFELGKKYDVIILSHVLEHTLRPVDIIRGIMENLLREDGYLILAVPNLGRLEISLYHLFKRNYVNKGHVYGWDRPHWMNFLENILGLDVIKYQPDYFPFPKLKNMKVAIPVLVKLGKWFPWYSYSNIALVKKTSSKITS